jgi:hypothetical protein
MNRHQQVLIEYLQEEIRVLKEQLGKRPRFNDDQRRRLAGRGKSVGHKDLLRWAGIVTPDTLLGWHRRLPQALGRHVELLLSGGCLKIPAFKFSDSTPSVATQQTKKKRNVAERVWLGCFALVAVIMLYGLIRYPYAPIQLRDDGYRDKVGNEFTKAQFHSFTIRERWLLSSFAVLGVTTIPMALSQRKRRAR